MGRKTLPSFFLAQGRLPEARDSVDKMSSNPVFGRDLLQACLDPRRPSTLPSIVQMFESVSRWRRLILSVDFATGNLLAHCGQKESALRVLKSAVDHNYCAYADLQSSPLLANLRTTPEFSSLLSAAKQCRNNFLAERTRGPH